MYEQNTYIIYLMAYNRRTKNVRKINQNIVMSYPKLLPNTAAVRIDDYYPYRKGQQFDCIQQTKG